MFLLLTLGIKSPSNRTSGSAKSHPGNLVSAVMNSINVVSSLFGSATDPGTEPPPICVTRELKVEWSDP
jgi:hypothetical protein